jgi:DNA-binding FrmR family transcriptional regulator
MIEEDRYCIDISNQIIASQGLLKRANKLILRQHMTHCVKAAIRREYDQEEKINEVMDILDKLIDK